MVNQEKTELIISGLTEMSSESFFNSKDHGFHEPIERMRRCIQLHDPEMLTQYDTLIALGRLMLITTEVAEAAEAIRHGDKANYAEELADILIRVGDESFRMDVPLGEAVVEKHKINRGREKMHGKLA